MPIHDLGFRRWEGARSEIAVRWWVIAQTGIGLVWKSSWVRRLLFFAWLPTMAWAAGFFFYERTLDQSPRAFRFVGGMLQSFETEEGEFKQLIQDLERDPAAARHQVWAVMLMIFFRSPQAILMVMLVGLIAPPLISRDVRSRAFLVYFSRPLFPYEYVLGKSSIVWTYLLMITCLPALMLYVMGILLSPDLSVVGLTWDLPLRICAASVVLLIPTTAVALCFSALTSESRFAAFAWFAFWILGWVSYTILSAQDSTANFASEGPRMLSDRWTLLSPYVTLGEVQKWIFGFKASFSDVQTEAIAILIVTSVALAVLLRRVSAPLRV